MQRAMSCCRFGQVVSAFSSKATTFPDPLFGKTVNQAATMKILCVLLLAGMACVAEAAKKVKCEGRPRGHIDQFNGRSNEVFFPCKFYAVKRQVCGKYQITLTPGNVWLKNNYFYDTYYMRVYDTGLKKGWEGRTTNKLIVKYHNSNKARSLFNKVHEELFPAEIFKTDLESNGAKAFIEDRNKTFKVTLKAWDPDKQNDHPTFKIECFDKNVVLIEYPEQVCGGKNKTLRVTDRASNVFNLGDNHRHLVIYYDVFMSDVVQTDEECQEAADIIQNRCHNSQDRRMEVLKHCAEILHRNRHTECVTYFQCTPMEAFNSCLRWGCTGEEAFAKEEKELCAKVGEAIDMCGIMTGSGNITTLMKDANCFKEYLEIVYEGNDTDTR